MAVEGVPKGSYIWRRPMLHVFAPQAQTKSSKSFKTWEGMREVNDYDPLSLRGSAIFVLLRGTSVPTLTYQSCGWSSRARGPASEQGQGPKTASFLDCRTESLGSR